jgi:hypothetical protein
MPVAVAVRINGVLRDHQSDLSTDCVFPVYSITKTLTARCVLRLTAGIYPDANGGRVALAVVVDTRDGPRAADLEYAVVGLHVGARRRSADS